MHARPRLFTASFLCLVLAFLACEDGDGSPNAAPQNYDLTVWLMTVFNHDYVEVSVDTQQVFADTFTTTSWSFGGPSLDLAEGPHTVYVTVNDTVSGQHTLDLVANTWVYVHLSLEGDSLYMVQSSLPPIRL